MGRWDAYNDNMISRHDDYLTSPDEVKPVETCTCCGCDLYEGDYIFAISGEKLCESCVNDNYRRLL